LGEPVVVDNPVPIEATTSDDTDQQTPTTTESADVLSEKLAALGTNPAFLSAEEVKDLEVSFLFSCGKYVKGKRTVSVGAAKELFVKGMAHNALVHEFLELAISTQGEPPSPAPVWFDCNVVDEDGWGALHHASGEGKLDIVQWLCSLETPAALLNTPHSGLFATKFCINMDTLAGDGCTALWVAGFNGQRDVVNQLLLCGADDTIKGCPENEPSTTPALACRRNRQPGLCLFDVCFQFVIEVFMLIFPPVLFCVGLADLLDTERELRSKPDEESEEGTNVTSGPNSRLRRQMAREMPMDEYKESIRALNKPKQTVA